MPTTGKKQPQKANQHTFRKGQSGNPHGRPKFDPNVKQAFIKLAPLALQRCEEVLTKKKTKAGDIIKAASLVLAYVYGKPVQPLSSDPDNPLIPQNMVTKIVLAYEQRKVGNGG